MALHDVGEFQTEGEAEQAADYLSQNIMFSHNESGEKSSFLELITMPDEDTKVTIPSLDIDVGRYANYSNEDLPENWYKWKGDKGFVPYSTMVTGWKTEMKWN